MRYSTHESPTKVSDNYFLSFTVLLTSAYEMMMIMMIKALNFNL